MPWTDNPSIRDILPEIGDALGSNQGLTSGICEISLGIGERGYGVKGRPVALLQNKKK